MSVLFPTAVLVSNRILRNIILIRTLLMSCNSVSICTVDFNFIGGMVSDSKDYSFIIHAIVIDTGSIFDVGRLSKFWLVF